MNIKKKDSSEHLRQLVQHIEAQLAWGEGSTWTNKDFQELSDRIFERTRQQLSVTTLKRVWGRAERIANPSGATLDILAEFAGHASWRAFRQRQSVTLPQNGSPPSPPTRPKRPWKMVSGATLLLVLLISVWYALRDWETPTNNPSLPASSDSIQFSFEKVATGYPNTVIFRYHVGDTPYDSLTLQQSWDTSKRVVLTESQGLVTTTYYYPGYFLTKLLVDGQIVREKDLYIPTQGWQGLIFEEDGFVYLKPEQLLRDSVLTVAPEVLTQMNQRAESRLYLAHLTDDPQIDGSDFTLNTEFRMQQATERSVCQHLRLMVTGTKEVLGFHFTIPGCVGDLLFMLNKEMVSGRSHDLSAFGRDFSQWTHCRIAVQNQRVRVSLGDREVFSHQMTSDIGRVGGVQWTFEGAGEIRQLEMKDANRKVDLMGE